jgi:ABC-type phosphate transport system substrate-binding protein
MGRLGGLGGGLWGRMGGLWGYGAHRLAARSSCLLGALFLILVFAAAPARASSTAGWYSSVGSPCWIYGSFEEEAPHPGGQCDDAGKAGYVAGHMIKDTNDAEDYKQSQSGDYCSYSGFNYTFNQPAEGKELFSDEGASPLSSFQEGDGHYSVCANWKAAAQYIEYKYRCSGWPTTICYFGEKDEVNKEQGGGCIPSEERCECRDNGFSCECDNSGESCWKCVPSGCGEAIERLPCSEAEQERLRNEGGAQGLGKCEKELVYPEEPLSWGFYLENAEATKELYECLKTCAIQHYVSLAEQGLDDHPWAGYFGEPLLTVGNTIKPLQIHPSGAKAWGYVCPVLEEAKEGKPGNIIELCFEQWRASGNGAEWGTEHAEPCTEPSELKHKVSRVIALFGSGTRFATERAGSANTEVYSNDNEKSFGASVSAGNLENVIKAANEHCAKKSSLAPSEWALIGVASGVETPEAVPGVIVTAEEHDLSVNTEYQQLPIAISSENASEVTAEQAAVTGIVTPYGLQTRYIVEYGPTTSYGMATAEALVSERGMRPVSVKATLSGLSPGTTYHYRIKAFEQNDGGQETTYGPAEEFKTEPAAPTVETEAASSVAETSATLHATVTPEGATVSECYFEYGPTESYGSRAPCKPMPGSGLEEVEVSAPITGLSKATTYHFRIVATNSVNTSLGVDWTFTTPPYPPFASTGAAASVTETSATLKASVDPNGSNVSACTFEYGPTTAYGKSVPCTPSPGSGENYVQVSATVTGLTKASTYHFQVVATNGGGSSNGGDSTFMTRPHMPAVVTDAASAVTPESATLNATVNPSGETVSRCEFEYGPTVSYGSTVPCTPAPGSGESAVAVSAALQKLSPQTYHYRIVATNPTGTSYGSDQSFEPPASERCEGVSIEGIGSRLQSVIQKTVWGPDFNTSPFGCPHVSAPQVKYRTESTSEAFASWPPQTLTTKNAFIATEQPFNPLQTEQIEKAAEGGLEFGNETLLTVPVLQTSVAVIVHLPAGCKATSTVAPGRLVLKYATLEKIFDGSDTEWSKIKSTEGGDAITGCTTKGSHITRVVPAEGSGTTAIFEKYLHLISKAEAADGKNWQLLAEELTNTTWPNEGSDPVVRDESPVAGVLGTPGSIGFAGLDEARPSFSPPSGGPETPDFWVEVENNKTGPTYTDPSSNGDVATKANANCEETDYTNGEHKFPPPRASDSWSAVTTSLVEKNYPICGFGYIEAFTYNLNYYSPLQPTELEGIAETTSDYANFALSEGPAGGQGLMLDNDYEPLPKNANTDVNVLKLAREGAAEIHR